MGSFESIIKMNIFFFSKNPLHLEKDQYSNTQLQINLKLFFMILLGAALWNFKLHYCVYFSLYPPLKWDLWFLTLGYRKRQTIGTSFLFDQCTKQIFINIQGVFYFRPSLTRRNSLKNYRISKSKGTFDIYITCAIW